MTNSKDFYYSIINILSVIQYIGLSLAVIGILGLVFMGLIRVINVCN